MVLHCLRSGKRVEGCGGGGGVVGLGVVGFMGVEMAFHTHTQREMGAMDKIFWFECLMIKRSDFWTNVWLL